MKRLSCSALSVVVVAVVLLLTEAAQVSNAATCSPLELSSCLPAITSSSQPSPTCCGKLKEQKPCLCGYLKNPNLKPYISSPGAKKVAHSCGVALPNC
ncbi:non-specific lipid-transfer protein 2 [Ricinus communis]|uniref:non-specific lipid-transfer protein 2 n=1 Tax=Ricinus communis TaxID=3988 RepID=UPI00201AFFCD|nr:non-specific lipid-transfer protein 2 [Ricinus communis]